MQNVNLEFVRSMMDEIDWDDRLLMIKGQKGVGKTTLMTQRILQVFGPTNTTDVLYASLDNIYYFLLFPSFTFTGLSKYRIE